MKFLDSVVDALAKEVREDPSGAKSLAHVLVTVPTAQSGRRLRSALAKRFGALVPPEVRLRDQLLLPPDDPSLATRADELVAFHEALAKDPSPRLSAALAVRDHALAVPAQLSDLRRTLAEKALSFADVAGKAEAERERWRELAGVEERYLAALARRGRTDRIEAMKKTAAGPSVPPGIEKVFRFDNPADYHLPSTNYQLPSTNYHLPTANCQLLSSQILPCGTAASEAWRIAEYFAAVKPWRIAEYFAAVKPDEALPALCVVDPEMFAELQGAFEAKGMKLRNPASTRLSTSSLGQLVRQISALIRSGSYSVFSSFVRGGDVRRWLCEELSLSDREMSDALVDLDNRQQELLPETVDDIAPKTEKRLRRIFEFVKVQLRKKGVRGILRSVFRGMTLDERDESSREFAAAADCVSEILDEIDALRRDGVAEPVLNELFERLVDEAAYNLEPDEGEVVTADGWMEIPFLDADEIVIAGFREGCVPESVVGHPYLPDSLRRELGLTDNAARTARDRAVLALALAGRKADAVKVCFHSVDAKGDVLKPSRLLFETADDAELCARVKRFYGAKAGTEEGSAADLPRPWKLKLPIPPAYEKLEKLSPTRLDTYLRCPFTYFLRRKDVLGDKRLDDRAEELASWEYGNLAHEALEAWGLSDLKDSTDAGAIAAFLEEKVDAQLVDRFGTAVPAIVAMQGESVKRRLKNFSAVQAARRAEGWRIVAVERKLELAYDHVRFHGKCDRVDFNPATGRWCVIDYKTWDKADKAEGYVQKKDGSIEWHSLQLPIYCAMLDALGEGEFAAAKLDRIESCYCVLGRTKDDVRFTPPMTGGMVPFAEEKIRELIPRIEQGIFWPPGPKAEWKYDYEDWLYPTPEASVDEDWLADQLARLAGASGENVLTP